jgi:diguanylate cyclase (GGDEF)-like protein
VDIMTLPTSLWAQLMVLRLLTSAAFAGLVYYRRPQSGMFKAYRAMAMLFAIPTLFYVASHLLMTRYQLQGVAAAIATGYAFLPFVLLAGFAIFPLTLLESVTFSTPVLVIYGIAGIEKWVDGTWPTFAAEYWLLILIAGVATLASLSQLVLMMALVGQAIRDPLTGCYSRRSGEEILALQFEQSVRTQTPLSLAFIDLDHFKRINDSYGHEAGDKVLKSMVRLLTARLRRGDILTRWGGEEFLLILPNTNCQNAMLALGRLYSAGLGMRPDGSAQTASTGTSERINDDSPNWQALVKLADERMYLSKQNGRNQTSCHDRDNAHPSCQICLNHLQAQDEPAPSRATNNRMISVAEAEIS